MILVPSGTFGSYYLVPIVNELRVRVAQALQIWMVLVSTSLDVPDDATVRIWIDILCDNPSDGMTTMQRLSQLLANPSQSLNYEMIDVLRCSQTPALRLVALSPPPPSPRPPPPTAPPPTPSPMLVYFYTLAGATFALMLTTALFFCLYLRHRKLARRLARVGPVGSVPVQIGRVVQQLPPAPQPPAPQHTPQVSVIRSGYRAILGGGGSTRRVAAMPIATDDSSRSPRRSIVLPGAPAERQVERVFVSNAEPRPAVLLVAREQMQESFRNPESEEASDDPSNESWANRQHDLVTPAPEDLAIMAATTGEAMGEAVSVPAATTAVLEELDAVGQAPVFPARGVMYQDLVPEMVDWRSESGLGEGAS